MSTPPATRIDTHRLKEALGDVRRPPPSPECQRTSVSLLLIPRETVHILTVQKADRDGYPWRNQVALPGGHVEETDKDALSAAFRELEEETAIPPERVTVIGSIGHFQTIRKKDIEVFLGVWDGVGQIRFDSMEISRVLEVSMKTLLHTHDSRRFSGRMPNIDELIYPLGDVNIWGVTAKILHFFIEHFRHCFSPGALEPAVFSFGERGRESK